ncbi:MAG: DUF1993 family protein [Burkholderiales bacterium]
MTHPLYTASVPVFQQMLGGLSNVLTKAQAHAEARKIEPNALLQARLYPDMFTLVRQVLIACDFAKGVSARLAGAAVPAYEDNEQTFEDLQARIRKTLGFIESLPRGGFEGSDTREVLLNPGTPRERHFASGTAYLNTYGLPHFYFHTTTAYAILRHNGVEIGKKDYMGA